MAFRDHAMCSEQDFGAFEEKKGMVINVNKRRDNNFNKSIESDYDNINAETFFTGIASDYVRSEGEKLRAENEYYINNAPFPSSRGFEDRVYNRIRAVKHRRYAYIISAIAASLIVLLIGFNAISAFNRSQTASSGNLTADNFTSSDNQAADARRADSFSSRGDQAADAEHEGDSPRRDNQAADSDRADDSLNSNVRRADAERTGDSPQVGSQAEDARRADSFPSSDNQAADSERAGDSPRSDNQAADSERTDDSLSSSILIADSERADSFPYTESAVYEVITLSFELPTDCIVSDVMQDVGQTVYYIKNAKNDDIILTAEKSTDAGGTGRFDKDRLTSAGLVEIEINNTKLYAIAKADFSRFTFQKEDIIYNMTCKYDYNTLVSLCEYVL